jgi:hypothetical protein
MLPVPGTEETDAYDTSIAYKYIDSNSVNSVNILIASFFAAVHQCCVQL